jgi:aminoglycoside phosphotransferase (APT) family kinase protein
VNYDERGSSESIFRFLQKLQRAGFGSGVYGAPQPLWYDRAHHFFVYIPFAGDRVRDLLEQGRLTQQQLLLTVQHTAQWLHRFHQLPSGAAPKKVIRVQSASLSLLPRTLQSRAQQHLARLNQLLAAPRRLHLVHGDPHLANCISSGKNAFACIDFSESYAGSPVADVAMFLVHLDVALRAHMSIAAIRKTQERFLAAYYGHAVPMITPVLRQSIIAHQVYTALVFLSFTQDHHHRPSQSIRAILQRLQHIVDLGLKELDSTSATVILAS